MPGSVSVERPKYSMGHDLRRGRAVQLLAHILEPQDGAADCVEKCNQAAGLQKGPHVDI